MPLSTSKQRGRHAKDNSLRREVILNAQTAFATQSQQVVRGAAEADTRCRRIYSALLASSGFAAFLLVSAPALAQVAVAPNLGAAAPFAVLGRNAIPIIGTVTCNNTGPAIGIFGQVGTTFAGGITNAPPCLITGPIVAPVTGAVTGAFDAAFASVDLLNPACTGAIPLVTTTLIPGVYCSAAGTSIGAGVIITLLGNSTDVWVFRVGTGGPGALTLTNAQVVMGGTALACNVYWKTSAGATTTDSTFVGTVLSGAAATMTRGSWVGRLMATTDATLTDPQPMTFAGCAAGGLGGGGAVPALSEWAMVMLATLLAIAGFAAMRRYAR